MGCVGTGGRILGIVYIYIYRTLYIYMYIQTVQRFPVPFHTTYTFTYLHYLFLFDISYILYESSLSLSQFIGPCHTYVTTLYLLYSTLLYSTGTRQYQIYYSKITKIHIILI